MAWKMSLLVICEILVVFINTLTADDKYSLHNSDILLEPIYMQLSKKEIFFSQVFAPFLKFTWIFEHFEQKDDPHSLYISEITEWEKRAYIIL